MMNQVNYFLKLVPMSYICLLPISKSIVGQSFPSNLFSEIAIKYQKTVTISNVNKIKLIEDDFKKLIEQFKVKSFIISPVIYKNKIFGLLIMDNLVEQGSYST